NDQEIERQHQNLWQRPQGEFHRLAVADRDQRTQQDEQQEQAAGQELHAASMAQRAAANREELFLVAGRFRGSRAAAESTLDFLVQAVAQVLAGLEVRHAL